MSILRECKGDGNASVVGWWTCDCGPTGYKYKAGTRGSGVVSSADHMLEMSVVRGGGGGRIGFGLYQSCCCCSP